MIKILLIDDHTLIREGLKQILTEQTDLVVTAEASSGQQALELIPTQDFGIVLLDIGLPDLNGIEVLKAIKQLKPQLPVLILTMYSEEQYAIRLLKMGAAGYLSKESSPEQLVNAIRKILAGGKFISQTVTEQLLMGINNPTTKPLHEQLSARELQIFSLIAAGKTLTDIAQELFLSVKTISTYRSRILTKMALKSNADLVRYAVANHL